MDKLTCQHCGHTWHPRIDTKPVRCPKCSSTTWDASRRTQKPVAPTHDAEAYQALLDACKAVLPSIRNLPRSCALSAEKIVMLEAAIALAEGRGSPLVAHQRHKARGPGKSGAFAVAAGGPIHSTSCTVTSITPTLSGARAANAASERST